MNVRYLSLLSRMHLTQNTPVTNAKRIKPTKYVHNTIMSCMERLKGMSKQQKNTEDLKYAQSSNTDARTSDFLFWGYNFKKLTHFDVTYEHFVLPDTETDMHDSMLDW